MKYVDVILPLPLEGTFTYTATDEMAEGVRVGMRVVVPLGKTKTYTGIVAGFHDEPPQQLQTKDGKTVELKAIADVPDAEPVLLPQQLKLWQWISDYYMSPIGEVMKAALPAGLKAEEGWRPRTETCVGLSENFRNERALHIAFDMLKRAQIQQKVLACYLDLRGPLPPPIPDVPSPTRSLSPVGREPSRSFSSVGSGPVQRGEGQEAREVTREELMNTSHCTAANVKALVDRKILYLYEREVGRLNSGGEPCPENIKLLSEVQQDAYNHVLFQMMRKRVVLLHGVTSSGKTEIYIHLIQKTIDEGQQVLYLLPEIALTVQMMERLHRVFGRRLSIYHSKYSDAERVEIWKKQLSKNPYDVILGARSAVFLPFQRLGLVIVDEEHETSFKQQEPMPRYHARSAAIMMGANVLLGTATPSMESYYNALQGKYGLVELQTRHEGLELPEIRVVDVKDLRRRKMMKGPFSPPLLEAMRQAMEEGRQVILFQNRRGFAPMVECKVCGWVPKCQNCDVSLTLHKNMNQLTCHYCGYTYAVPTECPCCGSNELKGRGYGTEKIEDQVRELFPEARVARMDLDTTRTRNAYERLIGDFSANKTNVLIGTQMVSKGLDFDRVAVVGILDADSMLNYPDFRAYEHAFMMMSQVAGRAGRKGKRGLVLLQTKNAELPVVRQVVANDWRGFYNDLIEERRMFNYPPFFHLVYVYLKHRSEDVVESAAVYMGGVLRQWFGQRILGPDKPAVARVKTLAIRKIVIKLENGIDLQRVREYLRKAQEQVLQEKRYSAVQIFYDVDPL